jgi:putative hemolysin
MDPHTRFPVIEEQDRGRVLGYVNFKELVYRARTNPADPTLRGIIRPIHVVGPNDSCRKVMRAFLDEHVHIAIVRDEAAKQTLGLVTLEDLVEELFGEIEDEFDRPPRMCQALTAGVWIVGGGLAASEMFTKVGLTTVEATRDNVSAWLLRHAGGLPKLGQVFAFGERAVTVRRIRRGKIFEILVTPKGVAPKEFM